MCADCSTSREEEKPICQLSNSGEGMASQTGVCQRGCGLLLSAEDGDGGEHCCVDALRTVTDALEERRAAVEHEARMARLRWNRREQVLLAQVSTLQSEAQLAALQYQRRLHQYMLHISSIAEQVIGYCKVYTQLWIYTQQSKTWQTEKPDFVFVISLLIFFRLIWRQLLTNHRKQMENHRNKLQHLR